MEQKEIQSKFAKTTAEETASEFAVYLGEENIWFMKFIFALKEEWINKGYKISDILIREDKVVQVAPLKTYVPFISAEFPRGVVPKRTQINEIAKKFIRIQSEDDLKAGSMHEFSFFILGLGIFRVSYSHDDSGVGMSIRYLTFNIPEMEQMRYPKFYRDFIENMLGKNTVSTPRGIVDVGSIKNGGLILHVGPTGSGKTTGIASEVGFFAERITGAIATYENPIEYRYTATKAPIRQYEIGVDIKKTDSLTEFGSIKRHLLRNNPSLVVIGEARDREEIREMIDTAARGHLVLSTIHASSSLEALSLLMGITKDEPELLANSLHAIVAHKLLTNQKGEIVPVYDIIIPDVVFRSHISKGDTKEVSRAIVGGTLKTSITFSKSLHKEVSEGRITVEEMRRASVGTIKEDSK